MIKHIAPRQVAVVSRTNGTPEVNQLDLDSILGLDLSDDQVDKFELVADLRFGKRLVVGRYSDPAEAGADFGKLRVLLGLPAWPQEWEAGKAGRIQDVQPRGIIQHAFTGQHVAAALVVCILIGLAGGYHVGAHSGAAPQTTLLYPVPGLAADC